MKWGGSLNPPKANKAISTLRASGIDLEPLNSAIRCLGATPGKPPTPENIRAFLDGLQKGRDFVSLEQTGRDRESQLKALGTVLGWFEKDPQLSLLASDVEFTTASVYNNAAQRVSEHQIDALTKLTEEQLRALGEITRLLRTDVELLWENTRTGCALSPGLIWQVDCNLDIVQNNSRPT